MDLTLADSHVVAITTGENNDAEDETNEGRPVTASRHKCTFMDYN